MERLLWLLALGVTFFVGWTAAGGSLSRPSPAPDVEQLRAQVATLQARLHAREEPAAPGASGAEPRRGPDARTARPFWDLRVSSSEPAALRGGGARGPGAATAGAPAATASIDAALDRFYKYLETTRATGEGRERWQKARELVEELRSMGD